MPEVDALFWALKAAYGSQCLEDDHELTFAGEGFLAHLGRAGQVTLRVAEGPATPVQGWLMAALAEYLAPAGAKRHVGGGVNVPAGRHTLHFRSDGTVRLTAGAAALAPDGPVPTTVPATGHHLGSLGQTLDAAPAPNQIGGPPQHPDWPAPQGSQQVPSDPPAPISDPVASPPPAPRESLSQAIASLAAQWLRPSPDGDTVPPDGGHEIDAARAMVNDLLRRVRDGELPDPDERRAAQRKLAGVDAVLRTRAPERRRSRTDSGHVRLVRANSRRSP